jgi:gliding motility-associated-like protein
MRIFILLTLLFVFTTQGRAQLIVSQTGTVAQWVQNVLVGNGISVSNVTYTGSSQSIGTFTSGFNSGNMGITSGLILSTGNVTQLPGAGSAFCSTNTNGGSDPQLAPLITQSIKDAAVLEFDFVPIADTLKFRYVFGSEEYPEFVNSINDVFGFFVSGLSPYGGFYSNENIALIPNTTTPITINNINPGLNSQYYVNNASGTFVKLDGFTTVLTAWIKVLPCMTYHIKIAIGDAQDHIYDSAVFLEANSFTSNAIILNSYTASSIDTTSVEGCNDAILTFKLPQVKNTPTTIYYNTSGTATNGVDYSQLSNSVIIPAGQDSVNINIHPLMDTLAEPTEYITFVVFTSPCTADTIKVYIKDNTPPISTMPNDTIICGSGIANLISSVSGGYLPYSYQWNTGDTTNAISVSPNITTTYTLQITDQCQNDTLDSIVVIVSEPIYNINNDTICLGDTALVYITDSMNNTYQWISNGSTSNALESTPNSNVYFSFISIDTLGCSITDSAFVKVNNLPILQSSNDTTICNGQSATLMAYGNYSFIWSNGVNQAINVVTPNANTSYSVAATDSNSCKNTATVNVSVVPIPIAEINSSVDSICLGSTLILTATGGDEYLWNNGYSFQDLSVTPMSSTEYTVTVSNISQSTKCSDVASFYLDVKKCNFFYYPNAFTPNGDGLNDEFAVVGEFGAIDYYKTYIYDRWGKLVFSSSDPFQKWDGKYNGLDAPDGVYTYYSIIKEKFFDQYEMKGTVHLIR